MWWARAAAKASQAVPEAAVNIVLWIWNLLIYIFAKSKVHAYLEVKGLKPNNNIFIDPLRGARAASKVS